ncbi:hypothetical protein LOS78_01985 [Paracoccus sp. MA]|uniref:hypothetical protein n=1 Tax=Paracoccus sp. MA TaxID=2895796 RepID=UPI001E298734|nr:hypothetical protein [Paracoccus sp. MA]UFM64270.1 hypothetical protein LOS78_01985 [Paracoccus sp. MA]
MTTTYRYTARRRDDGALIHTGTIEDTADQGMGSMAGTVRAALVGSHPAAAGLEPDDIDVEMSAVLPGS